MIEEATQQIESLQVGIIALGVLATLLLFRIAKGMISGSGDDEPWTQAKERQLFARYAYNDRYRNLDMKAGPRGHLP
ncbi:hypothetical protein [Prosthecobacter dejongeii]|uniref:Uncharacterized protein n=1 Tax=Prosthecobacter dejongeii TaxID=48465 RepID=A0A7W8DSF3_9BACT|nr:hypothetical protein [Prosthecobacter dejongeii]MBB5040608.1 hypothetical protein [Prosthecobacter dejongeii]